MQLSNVLNKSCLIINKTDVKGECPSFSIIL